MKPISVIELLRRASLSSPSICLEFNLQNSFAKQSTMGFDGIISNSTRKYHNKIRKAVNCKWAWLLVSVSSKVKKKTIWEVQLIQLITLFPLSLLPIIVIVLLHTGHNKLPSPINTNCLVFLDSAALQKLHCAARPSFHTPWGAATSKDVQPPFRAVSFDCAFICFYTSLATLWTGFLQSLYFLIT